MTNYETTNYVMSNYVMTNYVMSNYVKANYVMINYVMANYVMSGGPYSLKSNQEKKLFEKLFHDRFIYSQSSCQKSAERKLPKKYFCIFHFDVLRGVQTRALPLPT